MAKFSDIIFGKSPKIKQMPNFTPEQQEFLGNILQMLQGPTASSMNWLQSLFGDENFSEYEQPILDQFEQQTIPSILERFTGQGAQSSSGLNQALAQAGRGLSGDISQQRANMRINAINPIQNFIQTALGKQTTPYMTGGTQGAFGGLAQNAGPLLQSWLSGR